MFLRRKPRTNEDEDDDSDEDEDNNDENQQAEEINETSDSEDQESTPDQANPNSPAQPSSPVESNSSSSPGHLDLTVRERDHLSPLNDGAAALSQLADTTGWANILSNDSPDRQLAAENSQFSLAQSPVRITRGYLAASPEILQQPESLIPRQDPPLADELGPRDLQVPGRFDRKLGLYQSLGRIPEPITDQSDNIVLSPAKSTGNIFRIRFMCAS